MHGVCFEFPLKKWFDFKVPKTTISNRFIEFALEMNTDKNPRKHSRILWINPLPKVTYFKDEDGDEMAELIFANKKSNSEIVLDADLGEWLVSTLAKAYVKSDKNYTFQQLKTDFDNADLGEFEEVFGSELFEGLRSFGLLVL